MVMLRTHRLRTLISPLLLSMPQGPEEGAEGWRQCSGRGSRPVSMHLERAKGLEFPELRRRQFFCGCPGTMVLVSKHVHTVLAQIGFRDGRRPFRHLVGAPAPIRRRGRVARSGSDPGAYPRRRANGRAARSL